MEENKQKKLLEYLSLAFILSYFLIHNILIVLIGIIFSIYCININFIDKFMGSINKNLVLKKVDRGTNSNNKGIKPDSINKDLIEENSNLTLVESIEKFGFIPSIDKNSDDKAA
tara:strand:- start:9 stop:350 length:342 start_codon:yes stop_codon:yes gene_type:complete